MVELETAEVDAAIKFSKFESGNSDKTPRANVVDEEAARII